MKKIFFCFLVLYNSILFSQIQYYYYPVPSGTTSNLNELIHRGYYYICGNNGVMLRSQGFDSNWNMVNSNTSVNINSFMKPAESFFIAFGNNGVYLRTANGIDWVSYSMNLPYNIKAGVYTAFYIFAIGDNGKIVKKSVLSSDSTWKIVSSGTTNNLNSICSMSLNLWIVGDNGLIIYSNDTLHTLSIQVSGTTSNINKIVFRNSSLGFAVGDNGLILRTTNGGLNWTQKVSNSTANLNNIELENSESLDSYPNLFISGNKTVLVSNDTGNTWTPDLGAPQYNLTSSFYFGKDYWGHTKNLYIGENGKIFKRTIDTTYHLNEYASLEANNIKSFFINSGIFDQDIRTTNTAGFEWPKGSGHPAIFTAGLCIGAFVNGELREAMASYSGEYRPGYCVNGNYYLNDYFKIYKVSKNDNTQTNWDWANWGLMVPYGAPYIDVNNNNIYEPLIDTPGVRNAKETIFLCMTDANSESHSSGEGFGGGTLPLGAEVHMTAWAYDFPGLQDVQFISYNIINKSTNV